jgi:hypothetical protein
MWAKHPKINTMNLSAARFQKMVPDTFFGRKCIRYHLLLNQATCRGSLRNAQHSSTFGNLGDTMLAILKKGPDTFFGEKCIRPLFVGKMYPAPFC